MIPYIPINRDQKPTFLPLSCFRLGVDTFSFEIIYRLTASKANATISVKTRTRECVVIGGRQYNNANIALSLCTCHLPDVIKATYERLSRSESRCLPSSRNIFGRIIFAGIVFAAFKVTRDRCGDFCKIAHLQSQVRPRFCFFSFLLCVYEGKSYY